MTELWMGDEIPCVADKNDSSRYGWVVAYGQEQYLVPIAHGFDGTDGPDESVILISLYFNEMAVIEPYKRDDRFISDLTVKSTSITSAVYRAVKNSILGQIERDETMQLVPVDRQEERTATQSGLDMHLG